MSNRRRARPPKADAAVDALLAATECPDCGSRKALRRWDKRAGVWGITPLHAESCPVRTGTVAPHGIAEAATAAVAGAYPGLRYERDSGDRGGGWVVHRD